MYYLFNGPSSPEQAQVNNNSTGRYGEIQDSSSLFVSAQDTQHLSIIHKLFPDIITRSVTGPSQAQASPRQRALSALC